MSVGEEQKDLLRRAKLRALARDVLGLSGEPTTAGPLTTLVDGDTSVVMVERGDAAALSGTLVRSTRRSARRVVLVADAGASHLTRLASYFAPPAAVLEVYEIEGSGLVEVEAAPMPSTEPSAVPVEAEPLVRELYDAGVEVVVEHGVVRGEVLGLEVARLVRWPTDLGGDGELHLEVGVGRFDRDATAAARADEAPADTLRRAVELVSSHRHPGAGTHPLQMLARERWLRSTVISEPSLVGAAELRAVGMTVEAPGLKDALPAAAVGADVEGREIVVVCSTGVDLALVPLAADARALHAPDARLVVAVPERDRHQVTVELAELLSAPGDVVGVAPGWS